MRVFMDEAFLLTNQTAVHLYEQFAKQLPIIDYHCHLDPKQIYENKHFTNLSEVWLDGDHYKWRAMRANGIAERLITGKEETDAYKRFLAYAETVPYTLGNPLYHWSHLELRRFFGEYGLINQQNAPAIWKSVNTKLSTGSYRARDLIAMSGVEVICTTDDPADDLSYHRAIKEENDFKTSVLPSFRPDKALNIAAPEFTEYIKRLGKAADCDIACYADLQRALENRLVHFQRNGCKVSDHAFDYVPYAPATSHEVTIIFDKALCGKVITIEEEMKYKTFLFLDLARRYAQLGWVMQLHINASRGNNSKMQQLLGPDTGYDSIHDYRIADPLVALLDRLESEQLLPKTILYSLNEKDLAVLCSMIGSFQGAGVAGKMQVGSAWWFNDTKAGMLNQLNMVASMGLLSRFVGMLTDSRSFLSYPRHEYFRRILCNMLGEWAEAGEVPADMELLGGMVQNICYYNAKTYFDF